MSADPAREYPSPYVYVGNDPFNWTDPTGTISVLGVRIALGLLRTLAWTAIGAGVGAGVGALWDYFAGAPEQGPSRTIQGAELGAMVGAGIGVGGGLVDIAYGYFRGGAGPYPVVLYNAAQETTVAGINFATGRSGAEILAEAAGIPRGLYDTYLIPFDQLNIAQTIVNLAQFSGRLIVVAHGNAGFLEMVNGNFDHADDLARLLNAAAWGLVNSIDFSVCFAAATSTVTNRNLAQDLVAELAQLLPPVVGLTIRAAEVGMGPIGSGSSLGVMRIPGNPVQEFFHHLFFGLVFRGDVIGNAGNPDSGWLQF